MAHYRRAPTHCMVFQAMTAGNLILRTTGLVRARVKNGYYEQEFLGKICHKGIRHTGPAIARFRKWTEQGTFRAILQELAEDLYERGKIDMREEFIDGSFASAKREVLLSARQSVAKGP